MFFITPKYYLSFIKVSIQNPYENQRNKKITPSFLTITFNQNQKEKHSFSKNEVKKVKD